MNYGGAGAGNYGQHHMAQMGQHMQQQQMHMNMQSQQNMAQRMHMMQQQGIQNAAYPGMHPGFGQAAFALNGRNPAEVAKYWPEDWKQKLSQERNAERKKQMFQHYSAQFNQMKMNQHAGMMQNPMLGAPQGGMMYGQGGGQGGGQSGTIPGMMNPAMMQNSKAMHNRNSAAQAMQMRMAQAQNANQPQGSPNVQLISQPSVQSHPPSVSQLSSVQNSSVPSPTSHLTVAPPTGHSPQILNPSTPQNPASVQPGSIDTNPPSQQDPEYIKLLQDLKKLHDSLRKVVERCLLDKRPLPKAHDKLLEIMEEKRTVPKDLLAKLIKSTHQILDQNSLIHPMLEEFKKIAETEKAIMDGANSDEDKPLFTPEKRLQLNPFSSVSHLFIRVPDDVPTNGHSSPSNIPGSKRSALDDGDVPQKKANLESASVQLGGQKKLELECMFGKGGKKWEMSEAAAQELSEIPWKIDPDSVPPSYKSPDVTVCIDAKILLVPPLRVQIPGSYPDKNPVVQFDRSFPLSVQVSAQLATLFERQLSLSTCRSITTIYESYKTACQELLRIKVSCLRYTITPIQRSQHGHLSGHCHKLVV